MRLSNLASLAALCALVTSCVTAGVPEMPRLASAEVSPDYYGSGFRRVGIMPFNGRDLRDSLNVSLQKSMQFEASRATPYEVVILSPHDSEGIEQSDPHRRGWYSPETVLELAQRYNLDAILFGTVTEERFYTPQLLSLTMDMVSAETGLVVWSSNLHLDANDERVRKGLHAYFADEQSPDHWRLAMISPERFGRFAAYQMARMF
jgi:hypothetical protein